MPRIKAGSRKKAKHCYTNLRVMVMVINKGHTEAVRPYRGAVLWGLEPRWRLPENGKANLDVPPFNLVQWE